MLDRSGRRVGRASAILFAGCLACGVLPNSAVAPVGSAMASVAKFKLQPISPVGVDQVAVPTAVAGALASEVGPTRTLQPSRALVSVPVARLSTEAAAAQALPTIRPNREEAATLLAHSGESASALPAALDEVQWPSFLKRRDEVEEFLRFGSREVPRKLVETIVQAAAATDVDPIYLMALADKESSFRTDVKASTSSAEGLFQFIERTWLDAVKTFGPKHGLQAEAAAITVSDDKLVVQDEAERTRILQLRRDPYFAAVIAAEMLRRDATQIGFKIGRQLNATELYLAHFLGLQEAARFINLRQAKRARSATAAFPAAAKANSGIFFERVKRGRRGLSVPEVYAKIDRMIDTRLELYQPVRKLAAAASGV